ncbi:MAG: hypothetical protein GY835_24630 [bacterium]|nr:hypothetical protein [bacterium]
MATVELLRELTGRDPQKRRAKKAELVAYIEQGVADPKMEPSIPRRAADAVIEYGLPVAALEDLVQAVARKRQHKTVDKPGAYFLARIRKICRQHGVRFTEPGRTYAARVES